MLIGGKKKWKEEVYELLSVLFSKRWGSTFVYVDIILADTFFSQGGFY